MDSSSLQVYTTCKPFHYRSLFFCRLTINQKDLGSNTLTLGDGLWFSIWFCGCREIVIVQLSINHSMMYRNDMFAGGASSLFLGILEKLYTGPCKIVVSAYK